MSLYSVCVCLFLFLWGIRYRYSVCVCIEILCTHTFTLSQPRTRLLTHSLTLSARAVFAALYTLFEEHLWVSPTITSGASAACHIPAMCLATKPSTKAEAMNNTTTVTMLGAAGLMTIDGICTMINAIESAKPWTKTVFQSVLIDTCQIKPVSILLSPPMKKNSTTNPINNPMPQRANQTTGGLIKKIVSSWTSTIRMPDDPKPKTSPMIENKMPCTKYFPSKFTWDSGLANEPPSI